MKMKKLTSVLLAAVTACSLTACGGDTTWTFRSGENTVTSGMYVGFSINAANTASSVEGFDSTKSPFDQKLEGTESVTWIQNKTEELAREYLAVEEKYAEYGLTLTEKETLSIGQEVDYYWGAFMGPVYEEEGCGKNSFTEIHTNNYKRNQLFEKIYGKGGEKEVSDDTLQNIFKENYVKGAYIPLSLKDKDNKIMTGDDLQKVKDDAEKLAARINAGEDFEAVKAKYLANPEQEIGNDPQDTSFVFKKEQAISQPYQGIAEGKPGKAQVIEDKDAIFVVITYDVMSGTSFDDNREGLLYELKSEEFNETVKTWASEISIEENDPGIKKHNPKHLKDVFKK